MGRSDLTEEELAVARYLMRFLEVRAVLTYDEDEVLEVAKRETRKHFQDRFVDEEQRVILIRELRKRMPELVKLLEIAKLK